MSTIRTLAPVALWSRFADICSIPHPSKHEQDIMRYIKDFATERQFAIKEDVIGNIVVCKPASKGMESAPTVVLQAHVDMVPQKNSDKKFNFATDPIEAYVDGEWVTANGTTLGADNGIGCAAMLAILSDDSLKHPALEALFTIDEETGLTGANGLGKDMLTGKILINLDSEDEGELYVGCAGAVNTTVELCYKEDSTPDDMYGYQIELTGLKGGHSGLEIILQRANANKVLVRFLREQIRQNDIRLSTFDGGGLRNAIPREARVIVAVPCRNKESFEKAASEFGQTIIREYALVESAIKFVATPIETPSIVVSTDMQTTIIAALTAAPNGILRMSDSMKGLVETSTNMSRVELADGKMTVLFMTRCMVNHGKRELAAMVRSVFELAGARVEETGDYDGWAPNMNSQILATMKDGYHTLYGKTPEVKAIHAGLECGIIGAKYEGMDMISIGPTMRFPHSPDEKVNIATVAKFYEFLLYTLANIK